MSETTLAERMPLRILLAEDNSVNQQLALLLLGRLGYRADVAANGLETLEAVERQPYDVILMDVQMPEMDGLEASRQLCQRYPAESRPRIIAITANAMQGDREMCLAAGMDDYLSKPIRDEELAQALARSTPRESVAATEQPPLPVGEGPRGYPGEGVLSYPAADVGPIDRATFDRLRATLLAVFADHFSPSVQASIWIMGKAMLEAEPSIQWVRMVLPNLHHWRVDLAPFGLENPGEVFVPTTEPHGLIDATVRRRAR